MAEVNKKTGALGLPVTRGSFQIAGFVNGTESDRFYTDTKTRTGKARRAVNFAVTFDTDKKQYVEASGMEQEYAYFSKSELDKTTGKRVNETIKVEWRDRKKPQGDFQPIGIACGLETRLDETGSTKNKITNLVNFDACEYLADNLHDDMPVLVTGNLTYSTYEGKHYKKCEVNRVMLSRRNLDFDDPTFEPTCEFSQRIVFTSIEQTEDKTKFIVNAKIVAYNSIEDVEFFVYNPELAKIIRKKLKPYNAVNVAGYINIVKNETSDDEDSWWGVCHEIKRAPTIVEFVIDGVDPKTLDVETYSEAKINDAIAKANANRQAKEDFGEKETDTPWGKAVPKSFDDETDEEDEW